MHGCGVQVRPERKEIAALGKGSVRPHRVRENVRARIAGERIGETGGRKGRSPLKRRGTDAVYKNLAAVEIVRQAIGCANGEPSLSRRIPCDPDTWRQQLPLAI